MALLEVVDLHAATDGKEILHGVQVALNEGEVVALMGPNGSGKSTLASVLMGHPAYQVTQGSVTHNGEDLLALKPEERARRGIFLAFQYPQNVAGVTFANFLRLAYNATHAKKSVKEFISLLKAKMDLLKLPPEFMTRQVNDGLSGGEKKRAEMLQLAVLEPKLAILDETDSGLDIDALKVVGEALQTIRQSNPAMTVLIITHYQRILQHIPCDRVAVMRAGKIIKEGTAAVLQEIDKAGYQSIT